jgi:hypothetical protein
LLKDFVAMTAQSSYLLDGPLMSLGDVRHGLIASMATDLLASQAFASRGDAITTLRALGHAAFDVFLLVDEAIYLAKQEVVAAEMAKS